MKSNKKNIFLLTGLVVLIWSLVVYRVLNYGQEDDFSAPVISYVSGKTDSTNTKDYSLYADYSEPFLINPDLIKNDIPKTKKVNKKPIPKLEWPEIHYRGTIQNKNKISYILEYNGETKIIQKKDSLGLVDIQKLYPDSVILKYKHERKTILRK
jgi:hypothetical protein